MAIDWPPNTKPPLPAPDLVPITVVCTVFTLLGTLFACARLFVRGTLLRSLKWDDHWLLLSMIFGIAGYIVIMVFTFRDFPNMRTDPKGQNTIRSKKTKLLLNQPYNKYYQDFGNLNVAAMALNVAQNCFSRLSLLFSYRRFTPPKSGFAFRRSIINTFAVLTAVHGVELTFVQIFPCYPFHVMSYPNKWLTAKYQCLAPRVPFFWGGILGLFIDAGVYGLPFWLLWKADLKRAERRGLYALFMFGTLVFCLSVVRFPIVYAPLNGPPLFTVPTEQMRLMWIVTVVEAQCILIAASIPTLRPLIRACKRASQRFRKFRREGGMRRLMMYSSHRDHSTTPPSYVSQDGMRVQALGTIVEGLENGDMTPEKSASNISLGSAQGNSEQVVTPDLNRLNDPALRQQHVNQPALGEPASLAGTMLTSRSRDVDIYLEDEQWVFPFDQPQMPPLPYVKNDERV